MTKSTSATPKSRADRRRYRRVRLNLPGKLFIPAEERELECTVSDLSPGGASVECEYVPEANCPIVLYVDRFGRFEGTVVHQNGKEFGVHFGSTALKRERTAEQLTLYLNQTLVDGSILRRHERENVASPAQFTRADGKIVKCEVLDISVGGVSLKTKLRPPIGEFVLIGQVAGRVSRHHEHGIGIEFVGLGDKRDLESTKLSMVR